MADTVKAAVLTKPGEIVYEERPRPTPGPGEVLVAPEFCGVCGSDVHYFVDGRIGDYVVESPLVPGHEFAGAVAELGEGVETLRVGQKVTVEPGVPCGRCARCRSGRYNLCPDVIFAATPPCDGALIELVCYPADFCFPLPDGVTTDVGSLAEPICCGVHTAERGSISLGDRVAILGDGPIALSTLMAVQASGGRVVMLTGLVAERMKLAEELGAERVLNAAQEDVVAAGKALDVDVAIDCAGAPATPQQCIDIVRRGGRAVLIGLPSTDSTPINVPRCIAKEVDVIAVMRYANNFPAAVELLRRRLTDARKLITHRFGFSQVADAFKLVHELRDGVIKAVIDFGK